MVGRFEVYRDVKGKFRFRLKDANYEIIAVSEAYETREACIKGIHSTIRFAPNALVKEI